MAEYMNTYCTGGLMLNGCKVHIHLDRDGNVAKITGGGIRGVIATKFLGLLPRPIPTKLIEERPAMEPVTEERKPEKLQPLIDKMAPNDLTTIALLLHAILQRLEQAV